MAKKVSAAYASSLCEELAILLGAGVSAEEALHLLERDETDAASKKILAGLYDDVAAGKPLSGALTDSGLFSEYMCRSVALGERSGSTEETLRALATYFERSDTLQQRLRASLLYPVVLFAVMLAVVVVLITRVLPIFARVYAQLGTELSGMALGMLQVGQWLSGAAAVIGIVVAVLVLLVCLVALVPPLRKAFSTAFTYRFGGKGVFGHVLAARFCSALATACAGGYDMAEAVGQASALCKGSRELYEKVTVCAGALEQGENTAQALMGTGLFRPSDARLLAVGAETGKLPEVLSGIAGRTQARAEAELDGLTARIEPTLVIITAVLVGVILLSVMLPLAGLVAAV